MITDAVTGWASPHWWLSGKESTCQNAEHIRDVGSFPGFGRPPGEGNGDLLQYSCLGNPMDGGTQSMGSQKSQT